MLLNEGYVFVVQDIAVADVGPRIIFSGYV